MQSEIYTLNQHSDIRVHSKYFHYCANEVLQTKLVGSRPCITAMSQTLLQAGSAALLNATSLIANLP